MIAYTPFWNTLKDKKITTYILINNYKVSSSTIDRMRKNRPITTTTINDLCRILDCRVEDIIIYIYDAMDQQL